MNKIYFLDVLYLKKSSIEGVNWIADTFLRYENYKPE